MLPAGEPGGPDVAAAPLAPAGLERRRLLSSGIWVALSTALPLAGTAVLSVVAGRVLGPELLGQQSLIAFVAALLTAVTVNALGDACIRTLAALRAVDPLAVEAVERWTVRSHLVLGVVVGGAVAGLGVLRGSFVEAWLLAGAVVLLDAVGWSRADLVIARDGWARVARRRLATQVASVVLGIAAVLAGLGIAGIFLAVLAASGLFLLLVRPLAPRRTRRPAATAMPVRLWGLFALAAAVTQIGSGRIEILFLGAFATGADIAHYTVATMLVTAAVTLPTAAAQAALPAVAAANARDARAAAEAVARALRVTAALSPPLCALLVAVAPALLVLAYGPDFTAAGELARSMALLALVLPCARVAAVYWQGAGLLRPFLVTGAVGAVLELALAAALIPSLTTRGAVLATLVGQAVAAVALLAVTWHRLGRPRTGGRGLLASLPAGALAGAAGTWAAAGGGLSGCVLGGAAAVVVFVAAALLLRSVGVPLLDEDDHRWLAGALPSRAAPLLAPLGRSR